MKRRITAIFAAAVVISGAGFLSPMEQLPTSPPSAQAAVTKSLEGGGAGGGNVGGTGGRLGDLLSEFAVPVLISLAGCMLIGALLGRNIGTAAGIVVVTLIGLIFLLSPQSIESLAKGIANTVF